MDDQRIAYHEAGHAVAAVWLGGEVLRLSLEPESDEGPLRDGEVAIRWHHRGLTRRELIECEVVVALAGPAAEMLYIGERPHPLAVRQWGQDWQIAWQLAGERIPDQLQRMRWLESVLDQLCTIFDRDDCWQAVAETADELSAHETIEGEAVEEIVRRWVAT